MIRLDYNHFGQRAFLQYHWRSVVLQLWLDGSWLLLPTGDPGFNLHQYIDTCNRFLCQGKTGNQNFDNPRRSAYSWFIFWWRGLPYSDSLFDRVNRGIRTFSLLGSEINFINTYTVYWVATSMLLFFFMDLKKWWIRFTLMNNSRWLSASNCKFRQGTILGLICILVLGIS